MRKWFSFPLKEGEASVQAHCDLPENAFEREVGKEGFFGPATHMYHEHAPTGWTEWEGDLRPHAFDTNKVEVDESCPLSAPNLLENANVRVRIWKTSESMKHLVRNGDGDDCLFIHQGEGSLFCDYGHIRFSEGDYLVIPRSTSWRIETEDPVVILMIEATNSSYMSADRGMVGDHAIFDPAVLVHPKIDDAFNRQKSSNESWKVHIKSRNKLNRVTYPFNPLDAVGWKGNLTVFRLNWRDIRPLMSHRYHLPPSAHTTFVADGFVICTFVPRPIETDPGALKVPFYHNNDDYDEVLFYHKGDFFSRDNIDAGMITLHPCGFPHGPHPKALAASQSNPKKETDEVAVMIDTRIPLDMTDTAKSVENPDYVYSWRTPAK
ncbi:putative Homogentisate 1,2-dioxygenase [Vibrio nigripulchritudo SFn27]|uniref:Putative Homogentisate 1,2-dioxygenase n=1 Tax=Vibrio nigripulchritudo TaxID=28173 RepID=U4KGE4_9VIBR|nr:homogentisate 1,2-dioxygenase [Vibrio nigripulchritudo]CCN82412.1 putative Homogentisate 1,2-dioxygenase [Vibrio nigripulchritudo BLFn1]CCN91398.1 putative Homogentisate 1,2-dioxygenase [Vibrio nigripulchritudo SFn27]CCN97563.1 putative Homogentisate 1,2-dioxygenase [Vibrio nigripulchritudo ENn2]CCO38705.1 putative Homogentisate 1,2-dioxygenase [Vibrio nigripulchritudo SFn135]CCO55110.1 putative Homogentisate 1,2-dioxygenase [Vibrio nigripulchritudo Wn13]